MTTAIRHNPLRPFLEQQGVLILDGGLATELEARGADLRGELWSARLLIDGPQLIQQIHLDYLEAGADCITSASYQATLPSLMRAGLTGDRARELLRRSVELAATARELFWARPAHRVGRLRPLVAASVGPYGAHLTDGSEYRGRYDKTEAELLEFHHERWCVLAASGADLLACETLPSRPESRALARLVTDTPDVFAWFSFTCSDEARLSDGSDLAETVAELEHEERIVAVGVNCTPPRLIDALIGKLRSATCKPIVVYPNSGERYDAASRRWVEAGQPPLDFARAAEGWRAEGATLIGGCCRTGPEQIRQLRARLLPAAL